MKLNTYSALRICRPPELMITSPFRERSREARVRGLSRWRARPHPNPLPQERELHRAPHISQPSVMCARTNDYKGPLMAGSRSGCCTKALRSSLVASIQSAPSGRNTPPLRTRQEAGLWPRRNRRAIRVSGGPPPAAGRHEEAHSVGIVHRHTTEIAAAEAQHTRGCHRVEGENPLCYAPVELTRTRRAVGAVGDA